MIEEIHNHPRNKNISFNKEKHTYTYQDETSFSGITSFIGEFCKPFDRMGIARGYAYKHNMTVKRVLALWDSDREYGNAVHDMIEDYINEGIEPEIPHVELENFKLFLETYNLEPLIGEWVVYAEEYNQASAVDILCLNEAGEYVVVDLKTMKKPIRFTPYDEGRRMSYPVNNLLDTKYNNYCLQVNLYWKWLKEKYNLTLAKESYILHIHKNNMTVLDAIDMQRELNKMYKFKYDE